LKKDFLELNPRRDQKARIDAAYEKQKSKLKQKIAQLEKKKVHMENKLRQPTSNDSVSDRLRAESNGNIMTDPSADSESHLEFPTSDTHSFHQSLTNKNSSLSLASMDSKSIGEMSDPDKMAYTAEQLSDIIRSEREYFEQTLLKRIEEKQVSKNSIVQAKL